MTIRNHKLRAGIALGTAIATPLATVQAQTQNNEDYTVIRAEGGMSESKFTQAKIGNVDDDDATYARGLYGSVEILRSVNNGWDWSVSATSQDLGTIITQDDTESSILATVDTSFSSRSIDFDLGKNFQRKNMDLRLSAGLTALQIEEQKGLGVLDGSDGSSLISNVNNKYLGFGGRLGMDAKLRLGENSPLSIFAGASTAITHGDHDMRKGLSFYDVLDENSTSSELTNIEVSQRMISSGNVNHTSANIGLELEAGNNTTFRIGVRHDKYSFKDGPTEINGESISGNTAYVGVAIRF